MTDRPQLHIITPPNDAETTKNVLGKLRSVLGPMRQDEVLVVHATKSSIGFFSEHDEISIFGDIEELERCFKAVENETGTFGIDTEESRMKIPFEPLAKGHTVREAFQKFMQRWDEYNATFNS